MSRRSKKTSWLLIQERNRWVGVCGESNHTSIEIFDDSDTTADAITTWMRSNGYDRGEVLIGIDSRNCLVDTVDRSELKSTKKYEVLKFAFEESLPWAAEDFEAAFLTNDKQAKGVAVSTCELKSMVRQLEANGIHIHRISPMAILLADFVRCRSDAQFVIIDHAATELVCYSGQEMVDWKYFASNDDACDQTVSELIGAHESTEQFNLLTFRENPLPALNGRSDELPRFKTERGFYETCLDAVSWLQNSKVDAALDFRKGDLSPENPKQAARASFGLSLALVVGLLLVAAGFLIRGVRYDSIAKEYNSKQANLFQQVFPSSRVPAGVLTRLTSEHKRLIGAVGSNDEAPENLSSLLILREFVKSLPEAVAVRFTEIRIDGPSLRIDGEVKQHSDASEIAERLRSHGFDVEPPVTRLLSGGEISFGLDAKLVEFNSLEDDEIPELNATSARLTRRPGGEAI